MGSIGQVAESSDLRNSDWSYLKMTGFVCFYHLQGQQDKTGHLRTLKGVWGLAHSRNSPIKS